MARQPRSIVSRQFVQAVERHGIALRQDAGLGLEGTLDPLALAPNYGLVVRYPSDFTALTQDDLRRVAELDAKDWSGMSKQLPDGSLFVLLNPRQTPERVRATVMEELAHVYLRHEPSSLITNPLGFERRTYDETSEQQAKWTAAAALLPGKAVGRAIWNGESIEDLAERFRVSVELVEFRVKTLRLWSLRRLKAA